MTQIFRSVSAVILAAIVILTMPACSKEPKTFSSLNEKMQNQANVLVETLKSETGLVLDYSIPSVKFIELRLSKLAGTIGKADPAKASLEAETCGAYVGECLRKKHGGDWAEETAEGKTVYHVKTPTGAAFTPVTWCYERITGTEKQNVFKKVQAEGGTTAQGK